MDEATRPEAPRTPRRLTIGSLMLGLVVLAVVGAMIRASLVGVGAEVPLTYIVGTVCLAGVQVIAFRRSRPEPLSARQWVELMAVAIVVSVVTVVASVIAFVATCGPVGVVLFSVNPAGWTITIAFAVGSVGAVLAAFGVIVLSSRVARRSGRDPTREVAAGEIVWEDGAEPREASPGGGAERP